MALTITMSEFQEIDTEFSTDLIFIHEDTPLSDEQRVAFDKAENVVWVTEDV